MPTVIGSSQPVKAEKKPAPQKNFTSKKKKDFFVESKDEESKEEIKEE